MKTVIMGDTHACWEGVNAFVKEHRPDKLIVLGDFGFWPKYDRFSLSRLDLGETKIYFIDGNHEDHDSLKARTSDEVYPNVFYLKRGSVIDVNGKKVLCIGGGLSIDKHLRREGIDWFREETISDADFRNLPPQDEKIDWVFSHTAPNCVMNVMAKKKLIMGIPDPSSDALEQIMNIWKPKKWFFAHFHLRESFVVKGCKFECLGMIEKDKVNQEQAFLII